MSVLERIVDDTREEVARRRESVPLAALESAIATRPEFRPFSEALLRPGVSLIAEHKRRSPSAGEIRAGATVRDIVGAYERGADDACSDLRSHTRSVSPRGVASLKAVAGAGELAHERLDVGRAHQRLADQHGVDADPLELVELVARREAGLRDDGLARRHVEIGRASCRERVSSVV